MKVMWFRKFLPLVLSAVLCMGFAGNAYADDDTKFVTGTTINGVAVAGLSVPDAVYTLRQHYADYTLTVQERNGKTETIRGSEIGYTCDITDAMVQPLLDQENAGGRKTGPLNGDSIILGLAVSASYDEAALEGKVNSLNCIAGSGITRTANAHISDYQAGKAFTIVPEVRGNSVDAAKLLQAVKDAIAGGQPTVSAEGTGSYDAVTVTSGDANLKAALATLNGIHTMTVTYTIGGSTETLDGATIAGWTKGLGDDGQIAIDADAETAYLNGLATKYNTAGTTRVFHTYAGADIELDGPLGWSLDVAAEQEALTALIRTGVSGTRTIDRPDSDWGSSYIEADLTAQHVYCFQDGNIVWDSPCVSGATAKERGTPTGLFYIYNKETDRILKGPLKDGKPEYESHVDYWMPFKDGSGLHDANWRSSFGGDIYVSSGSHGCINLPPAKAAELYGIVPVGYPCIVHY